MFVLVSYAVVAVLRQGTSLLGLLAGTLDIILEPLSDSSSCGGHASVSESLDAFTVLAGCA